jgi:hypothetical protein
MWIKNSKRLLQLKFLNYLATEFINSFLVMRRFFTERNIVVILFIMVLITFSIAQNETNRIEHLYNGGHISVKNFPSQKPEVKAKLPVILKSKSAE